MNQPAADEPTPRHDVLTQIVRAGLAKHGIGEPTRSEKVLAGQEFRAYAARRNVPDSHLDWARRTAEEQAVSGSRNVTAVVYSDLLNRGVRRDDALWASIMVGAVVGKRDLFARTPELAAGWRSIFGARRRRRAEGKALKASLPDLAASVRACPDDASDVSHAGSLYGPNATELSRFLDALHKLTSTQVGACPSRT